MLGYIPAGLRCDQVNSDLLSAEESSSAVSVAGCDEDPHQLEAALLTPSTPLHSEVEVKLPLLHLCFLIHFKCHLERIDQPSCSMRSRAGTTCGGC